MANLVIICAWINNLTKKIFFFQLTIPLAVLILIILSFRFNLSVSSHQREKRRLTVLQMYSPNQYTTISFDDKCSSYTFACCINSVRPGYYICHFRVHYFYWIQLSQTDRESMKRIVLSSLNLQLVFSPLSFIWCIHLQFKALNLRVPVKGIKYCCLLKNSKFQVLIYLKTSGALVGSVIKHFGIFFDQCSEPSLCLPILQSAAFDEYNA